MSKPVLVFLGVIILIALIAAFVTWRDYRRISVWKVKRTAFEDALDVREREEDERRSGSER